MPHHRSMRCVTCDHFETRASEGRGDAGIHAGRAFHLARLDRIRLERCSLCAPCRFERRCHERRRDTALAMTAAHVEARHTPYWKIVDALRETTAFETRQHSTRRELTPSNRRVTVEGEQSRWWTALHYRAKVGLVLLARSFAVSTANAPIHAPASAAGTLLTEEILERGPQLGREWTNGEWHRRRLKSRSALRQESSFLHGVHGHAATAYAWLTWRPVLRVGREAGGKGTMSWWRSGAAQGRKSFFTRTQPTA
jgi:hypothetical protein